VAATLAATVLVRVGAAVARAERERRCREQALRARQFALLPGERSAAGLRRIAIGQLDLTIELLEDEHARAQPARTVHEMRKALKRLRAIVRLLREELGEGTFARESATLRELGARLARARDAEVIVSTLDGLCERHPRKLDRRGVARLRERLAEDREQAVRRTPVTDAAARLEMLDELRALRARVAAWTLTDGPGIGLLEPGLRRLYRRGQVRYRRAARGRGDRAAALHEWRKRVKDLRYAAEVLDRQDPDGRTGKRRGKRGSAGGKRARAERDAAGVDRLARRADELGEVLGEEHDLAVLAQHVRTEGASDAGVELGRRTRKALLKLIARRRKELRRRALREGERLYRRRPRRFVARVRRSCAARERLLSRR
jgi:CHAD domain-containing protein